MATLTHKPVTLAQLAAFLASALLLADAPAARAASADSPVKSSTRAEIKITARVLERTSVKIINQVQELVVTDRDILRGYVDIPSASRVLVKSNNPRGYLLTFELSSLPNDMFDAINVSLAGRKVQLSPNGGWIPQPFVPGGVTTDLSYRFVLKKDAQPGKYSWPLKVFVTSI